MPAHVRVAEDQCALLVGVRDIDTSEPPEDFRLFLFLCARELLQRRSREGRVVNLGVNLPAFTLKGCCES